MTGVAETDRSDGQPAICQACSCAASISIVGEIERVGRRRQLHEAAGAEAEVASRRQLEHQLADQRRQHAVGDAPGKGSVSAARIRPAP